ncbi:MAG TPA: zinc metallopeptidase [Cytophagaceae bacterium]|jgi:Zn-dependent membrane protease YugP|nr:zinc metallopeptidase [Cytophagaceae bacterium]
MIIVIAIVTMLVSWLVSMRLKSKFREYSQIPLASGISGKEAAEKMLRDNGIFDVKVISVEGQLTDHYNPADKTVNLSTEVYEGRNAAAVAIAAHECGHAVQHFTAYSMLTLRSKLVPVQNVSAKVLNIIMMVAIFGGMFLFKAFPFSQVLIVIIACNAVITLFALVTLPVEFDASRRALAWIDGKIIFNSNEHAMAKDALWWAAMTYVVAAIGSLAQLLYYVSLFMGRRD